MEQKYIVHPEIDHDSAPYWQSLREHQAKLQKCGKCGRFRFPPSPSCYFCGTLGGSWEAISGKGIIYSWTVVHHPIDPRLKAEVPFVIVLVQLAEGVRIAGRLVNYNRSRIGIDMPVRVCYYDLDSEVSLLNFEPEE